MKRYHTHQQGDTIVEVIVALAVFAMVTASVFAIMQRGSISAYDSLERSMVRLRLNSQTELLTYFRDAYTIALANHQPIAAGSPADLWQTIVSKSDSTPPTVADCKPFASYFYIVQNTTTHNYELGTAPYETAKILPEPGKGLWLYGVRNTSSVNRKFYDFYAMACWSTTTSQQQTMSSIVRLYDPTP